MDLRLKRWLRLGEEMTVRIAFLGAGQMGRGMITNLVNAGHVVTVYNRSAAPFEALAGLAIKRGATPAEAVEGADVIMSMVTDDKASETLWEGPDGALSGHPALGALAIESSTVSIERIKALAQAAERRGLVFLDCPVAGRPDASMAGALSVFAGGPVEAVEMAAPVLEAISKRVFHFGDVGSGISFKLVYNAVGATQIASLAEAVAACRDAGMDLNSVTAALSEGGTGSAHVKLHGGLMASGKYSDPPPFTPAGRIKDLDYAIALMRGIGVEPVVAVAAREVYATVDPAIRSKISDTQIVDCIAKPKERP